MKGSASRIVLSFLGSVGRARGTTVLAIAVIVGVCLGQQPVPRGSRGNFRPANIAVGTNPTVAFMAGSDGVSGVEPWVFRDGFPAPTPVPEIRAGGAGSFPDQFVPMGGMRAFFTARSTGDDRELYYLDLSTGWLKIDINPGPTGSFPAELTRLNATQIVFTADDGTSGRQVWVSDGTRIGTAMVNVGAASLVGPHNLIALGSTVLFAATGATNGTELWSTDGVTAGLLRDLEPAGSSYPGEMARLGNDVYFAASTSSNGRELWRTNGTPAGTTMVMDIRPGVADSAPDQLTPDPTSGALAFTANHPRWGRVLFVLDAASVLHLAPVPNAVSIDDLVAAPLSIPGGLFLFSLRRGSIGREPSAYMTIWNAYLSLDLRPGPEDSYPVNLTAANGTDLIFRANNGATGQEPWRISLATGFPSLIANIKSGPAPSGDRSSWASPFVQFGSDFLFAAEATEGIELQRLSGTSSRQVANVNLFTPSHDSHVTTDATAALVEISDAAPSSPGFVLSSLTPLPAPLALPGTSGLLTLSNPVVTAFLTDGSGNASVPVLLPPVPLVAPVGIQTGMASGAGVSLSDTSVSTSGSCNLGPGQPSAEAHGAVNDDTLEYRVRVTRTDSNPVTAYFGLVYTTPSGERLLLEGGTGSFSLGPMESTELHGFIDIYTAEDTADALGSKKMELYMLLVPPTPQNVTSGCKVWESYC